MGISGSLQNFSLPEILRLIDDGAKSGRLSIYSDSESKGLENKIASHLWFKYGNFVAMHNPLKYNNLLDLIKQKKFVSSTNLVKLYALKLNMSSLSGDYNSLGEYCLKNSLLNLNQIDWLFEQQLQTVYPLFELEDGWFAFQDAEENKKVSERKESLPFTEMTGQKCEALTIALQGMRSLKKLNDRLIEQLPDSNSALIKLVDNFNLNLLPIEACLFDDANGQHSLKKIAQKSLFEIQDLQEAALRLIAIGLVEAVPVTVYSSQPYITSYLDRKLASSSSKNNINAKAKTKVSNSLLGNLVSFLRNNF